MPTGLVTLRMTRKRSRRRQSVSPKNCQASMRDTARRDRSSEQVGNECGKSGDDKRRDAMEQRTAECVDGSKT